MLWDKNFYENLPYSILDGIYYLDKSNRIIYWDKKEENFKFLKNQEKCATKYKKISSYLEYDITKKKDCENKIEESILNFFELQVNYIAEIYLFEKNKKFPPIMLKVEPLDINEIKGKIEFFTINSTKLSLLKVIDNLIKINNYDELTYTANYDVIFKALEEKIDKYKKFNQNSGFILFIVMINSNLYNDYNKILRLIGVNILRNIRIIDITGRVKDNIFLSIISNIKEKDLVKISERIKSALENTDFLIENKKINVTISYKNFLPTLFDSSSSFKTKIEKELK